MNRQNCHSKAFFSDLLLLNIAEGFAEASGTKLKEQKETQLSGNKAAVILSARSLLSPFLRFIRFLD